MLALLYDPGVCFLTTGNFGALETKTPRILLEVTCSGLGRSETVKELDGLEGFLGISFPVEQSKELHFSSGRGGCRLWLGRPECAGLSSSAGAQSVT